MAGINHGRKEADMITEEMLNEAYRNLSADYRTRIRPMLVSYCDTLNRLYAPIECDRIAVINGMHNIFTKRLAANETNYCLDKRASENIRANLLDFCNAHNDYYQVPGRGDLAMRLSQTMALKEHFNRIAAEYENFFSKGGIEEVKKYVENALNIYAKYENEDEKRFERLFGKTRTARLYKVNVSVEELRD